MDTHHALEVKFSSTEEGVFSGYASVFDTPIPHPIHGKDIIQKGAFARTLQEKGTRGVKLLWQHQTEEPIGRWMELQEDDYGLRVKGQLLLDLSKAREAYTMMKNGIIDGLSIGFTTDPAKTRTDSKGARTLAEIDLWEISLVSFPAQHVARVSDVKSHASLDDLLAALKQARAELKKQQPAWPSPRFWR